MPRFEIPILTRVTSNLYTLVKWIREKTIREKLFNPVGIIFFLVCGILFAMGTAHYGKVFAILLIAGFIAIPVLYAIVVVPTFGIVMLLLLDRLMFFMIFLCNINAFTM